MPKNYSCIYTVNCPGPLADAFEQWRAERGLNTNRALKFLIAAQLGKQRGGVRKRAPALREASAPAE